MLPLGIGDLQLGEIHTINLMPRSISIGASSKPPTNLWIGLDSEMPDGRENCTIIALGPNRFRYPESNVNIGHHFEGNSDTKQTLFYGLVEADGGFAIPNKLQITTLDCCDACGYSIPELPTTLKDSEKFNKSKGSSDLEVPITTINFNSEKSDDLEVPGIRWGGDGFIGHLCFDCIREVAMEYQAKKRFTENHKNNEDSDIKILKQQVSDLQKELLLLKEALNEIYSTNKKIQSVNSLNSVDCIIANEYGNHY